MVTEINFKFYKGLKGIEIVLAPCDVIILDKLDKTVKINIFIKVISRDIHSVTIIYSYNTIIYNTTSLYIYTLVNNNNNCNLI